MTKSVLQLSFPLATFVRANAHPTSYLIDVPFQFPLPRFAFCHCVRRFKSKVICFRCISHFIRYQLAQASLANFSVLFCHFKSILLFFALSLSLFLSPVFLFIAVAIAVAFLTDLTKRCCYGVFYTRPC